MRRNCLAFPVFAWLAVLLVARTGTAGGQSALPKPDRDTVLKAADITAKLFPETVFFRGQSAVQMRNTAGVHFSDERYVLAGMVDNSGYSTSIREKYQAYLLNEVPLEIGGQGLKPGAYGMGFIDGGKFVVLDLGANDLLQVSSGRDAEMKRFICRWFRRKAGNTGCTWDAILSNSDG